MAELELRAWVTVDGVRGQVMGTRGDEYLVDTQDGYARWYPFSAIVQETPEEASVTGSPVPPESPVGQPMPEPEQPEPVEEAQPTPEPKTTEDAPTEAPVESDTAE